MKMRKLKVSTVKWLLSSVVLTSSLKRLESSKNPCVEKYLWKTMSCGVVSVFILDVLLSLSQG